MPTLKIATNSRLAAHKKAWIDFDAGPVADGRPAEEVADALFRQVLNTASGRVHTKAEARGFRGMAIFKTGVTV